jgi:hypothetical protein
MDTSWDCGMRGIPVARETGVNESVLPFLSALHANPNL